MVDVALFVYQVSSIQENMLRPATPQSRLVPDCTHELVNADEPYWK